MAVYGYNRWLSFRKLLETGPSGFTYEGRRYAWGDVEEVDRLRRSFVTNLAVFLLGPVASTACVHLRDGSCIQLNGLKLTRDGETPRLGLRGCFRGESEAYRELVSLMEAGMATGRGPAG